MSTTNSSRGRYVNFWATLLAVYLLFLPLLLIYVLVAAWPEVVVAQGGKESWVRTLELFNFQWASFPAEARLLLIVIAAGALGSFVHAATSFATFLGNESLKSSWILWYLLRPLIGVGIALVFYFLVRGGLLLLVQDSEDHTQINPFGIAGVASLAGMFSKQATDKLREVFDSLFKSSGDDEREDKLSDAKPVAAEMIKRSEIQHYRFEEGQGEEQVSIQALYELFGPLVTRLPVFNHDWSLHCLVHQSLLYKFIGQTSLHDAQGDPPRPFALAEHNLKELLDKPGVRELTQKAVAYVGPEATLGDAKAAMEDVETCQDVFVTDSGDSRGEVVGWLTNGMIARLSRP